MSIEIFKLKELMNNKEFLLHQEQVDFNASYDDIIQLLQQVKLFLTKIRSFFKDMYFNLSPADKENLILKETLLKLSKLLGEIIFHFELLETPFSKVETDVYYLIREFYETVFKEICKTIDSISEQAQLNILLSVFKKQSHMSFFLFHQLKSYVVTLKNLELC